MEPVRLTIADTGTDHEVAIGAPVEVSLAEIPGTGYRWAVEIAPPDAASGIESSFLPGGPGVGAGGVRVYRVRFGRPGAVRLRFHLRREWEPLGTVADRAEFALKVARPAPVLGKDGTHGL